METFGKRLFVMLRETGIEKSNLAHMVGVHRTTVHWWLKDKSRPHSTHFNQLINIFPNFSPDWIQHGKGEVYKEGSGVNKKIEELEKTIRDKELIITLLQEKIDTLTKLLVHI